MNDKMLNGRGKGKRKALVHVSVRLPEDVVEFYTQYPNYTKAMREVLIKYKEEHDNG
jgi:uncharacterized protein (DUF4415 family)